MKDQIRELVKHGDLEGAALLVAKYHKSFLTKALSELSRSVELAEKDGLIVRTVQPPKGGRVAVRVDHAPVRVKLAKVYTPKPKPSAKATPKYLPQEPAKPVFAKHPGSSLYGAVTGKGMVAYQGSQVRVRTLVDPQTAEILEAIGRATYVGTSKATGRVWVERMDLKSIQDHPKGYLVRYGDSTKGTSGCHVYPKNRVFLL